MTFDVRTALILVAFVLFVSFVGSLSYVLSFYNTQSTLPPFSRVVTQGTRISNFLVQSVNVPNDTVSGLLYILYPPAYVNGTPKTLDAGDIIGYACDDSEWILTGVNANNDTAVFTEVVTKISPCPI